MKLPELLAPAGNAETAVAAYEAGADAVYCGLGKFNARERAENFTPETLGKVLEFARSKGRKLYLTLNTLIKENELPQVMEYLGELVKLSPDALIVQDPGVVQLVKEYFPQLVLHGSTQMGIHNSAGVAAAAAMGLKRVILERQLTLEELRKIAAVSTVELEVFVHGSLCCSLSGRCLLSSYMGGWSGNRGKCKQPCRRAWQTANGEEFALSPKDLYGLDLVSEFAQMGIASLKIEGRLRSPDYVWKTVRAYRMMLDALPETPRKVREEAEQLLRSTATRNPSLGFYSGRNWKTLLDTKRIGAFGTASAQVEKVTSKGIMVRTLNRLHLGDRLRLVPPDGGEGESFSLIRMESAPGVPATLLQAGKRGFLPGDFKAEKGFLLYKIGENGFDFSRQTAALPPRRYPVTLNMELSEKRWRIRCENIAEVWEKEVVFTPAGNRPFSREQALREFSAGIPAPWAAGEMNCSVQGAFFVPASTCKQLRREFWQWAEERLSLTEKFDFIPQKLMQFFCDYKSSAKTEMPLPDGKSYQIPGFIPQDGLEEEKKRIQKAYDSGVRFFIIGGIHGLELLKNLENIRIGSCFPLPVCNSRAAMLLKEYGLSCVEPAPELDGKSLALFAEHTPLPFLENKEPLPVLATRLRLVPGKWLDRRNRAFLVRYDEREKLSKLYPADDARLSFKDGQWL